MAYPQYNPYFQPQQLYQPQPQQQPQIQNSGIIINIPSESDARSYPVAPGNSLTFKDENAPYIYTKTMGFNQFDRPVFEKYRLMKEENSPKETLETDEANNLAYKELESQIEEIRGDIEDIKKKMASKTVKRIMKEIEVDDDDSE